jgi:hypothetical protein
MTRRLTILAAATLALAAKHFLQYAGRKGTRRAQREALQTWEGEGGAVPVSRVSTTAAQVAPTSRHTDVVRDR